MVHRASGRRHRPDDVVFVDVVRPDDDALAEAVPQVVRQVGEGVTSEASSEVVPDAFDLAIDVAPGRTAQRAAVALHRLSSRSARSHIPAIMWRRRSIVSPRTAKTSCCCLGSV